MIGGDLVVARFYSMQRSALPQTWIQHKAIFSMQTPLFGQRLDTVAEHGAGIRFDRMLYDPLVIIDKSLLRSAM
jgi:hypothetical protein